jgi:multidrug resistance efflux pump
MLERAGVPDVHDYSAGDLVEIANMLDELARLRADLATATEAGNVLTAKLASLRADLRTLSGALETERADAQRFRWMALTNGCPFAETDDVWYVWGELRKQIDKAIFYETSNATTTGPLDTAIDAAMAQGKV